MLRVICDGDLRLRVGVRMAGGVRNEKVRLKDCACAGNAGGGGEERKAGIVVTSFFPL